MLERLNGPILIIAPHPDDETFGAGGFLLRAKELGIETHWTIVTSITSEAGWPEAKVKHREQEIPTLAAALGFKATHRLDFPSAQLDTVPTGNLVGALAQIIKAVQPAAVLLPHPGDAHSDHHAVFGAGAACTKAFRYPFIQWVMTYETLSETDAGLYPNNPFVPNLFVDITPHLDAKISAANTFFDEMGPFPFPRSDRAIRALAEVRGAAAGYEAAEAFMLLRGRF